MARMIEEATGALARAWDWSAILKGAFTALALFVVLRYFGAALGVSTGDGRLETGFAVWSVLVELLAIGAGAVLAGYLVPSVRVLDGALAGAFTWVVSIVLMTTFLGVGGPQSARSALWGAFLGALLSLGGAMIGGILGAQLRRRPIEAGARSSGPVAPGGPPPPIPPSSL